MADESLIKPTKYFIDFENVHGSGLKGVDELSASDEVVIIYSQAAETFHIEHAIDILKSKAHIEFVEVDGGTRNAADFQLIVALFGDMSDEYDYAIVSGDGGFDAAIKMGERMGLPTVRRMVNIRGDIEPEKPEKPKSRRTRRRNGQTTGSQAEAVQEQKDEPSSEQPSQLAVAPQVDSAAQAVQAAETEKPSQEREGQPSRSSRRRSRRKASVVQEQAAESVESAQQDQKEQESQRQEEAASPKAEAAEPAAASQGDSTDDASPKRRPRRRRRGQGPKDEAQAQAPSPEIDASPAAGIPAPETAAAAIDAPSGATSDDVADAAAIAGDTFAAKPESDLEPPMREGFGETVQQPEPETRASSEPASRRDMVKAYFEREDVQLDEVQLDAVVNALDGVKGRQEFYHRIIRALKQQKGRALYRLVRDHYDALMLL